MDIKEKISGLAADITISTQGDWIAEIPVESFRMVAERVCHDPEEPMDYLRDIVGMDWGENGLGALYYLESTRTHQQIVLKTSVNNREQAFIPSVCDLWKTAEIKEREYSISSASAF